MSEDNPCCYKWEIPINESEPVIAAVVEKVPEPVPQEKPVVSIKEQGLKREQNGTKRK